MFPFEFIEFANKLKRKHYNPDSSLALSDDTNTPKVWTRIPYLGPQGNNLGKPLLDNLRRNPKKST